MSEHDQLNERLAWNPDSALDVKSNKMQERPEPVSPMKSEPVSFDLSQWSAEANDTFRPAGPARAQVPAGVYTFNADMRGLYLQKMKIVTDTLIELDDTASVRVLEGIRTFWGSKQEYVKRGIVYKRGVLLWGPAGSGKTATLALMTGELVATGGVVVLCENPEYTTVGLQILRRIEPERPLIVVMEDIDEMIARHGEHQLLALLDGENQINNVVNIATTNYPERLGARIVNRPSRFDERILIGMPGPKARHKYLSTILRGEELGESQLEKWVGDTDGFSVAHLRELAVAVFCLKQDYANVVERLSKMQCQPKPINEYRKEQLGYEVATKAPAGFGSRA